MIMDRVKSICIWAVAMVTVSRILAEESRCSSPCDDVKDFSEKLKCITNNVLRIDEMQVSQMS